MGEICIPMDKWFRDEPVLWSDDLKVGQSRGLPC
jgi:hypothetical protein